MEGQTLHTFLKENILFVQMREKKNKKSMKPLNPILTFLKLTSELIITFISTAY